MTFSCQAHVSRVCALIRMGHVCHCLLIRDALQGALIEHKVLYFIFLSDRLKPQGETKTKEKWTKAGSPVTRGANSRLVLLMIILHPSKCVKFTAVKAIIFPKRYLPMSTTVVLASQYFSPFFSWTIGIRDGETAAVCSDLSATAINFHIPLNHKI